MFLPVSVCHSVQGCHMWPLPMMHWTSVYRDPPLDMGPQCTGTPDIGPHCLGTPILLTSDSHGWRPVQTCTLQDPLPTSPDIWWLLQHVWSVQVGGMHPTGMLSCSFCLCLSPDEALKVLNQVFRPNCRDLYQMHMYANLWTKYICHGCGPVIPLITFVLTSDVHWPVYTLGHYGNSVWDGYRILFILGGGRTLTSPKGGRPCPLSTLNYEVAGHLAYW